MIVYLAAPIDFNEGSKVNELKDEIKRHFKQSHDIWLYDPSGAWQAPSGLEPNEGVHWANLMVLEQADILIAVLVKGVLTVGTVLEIQHAFDCGIPIVVIGDVGVNSVGLDALQAQVYESIMDWSEYGSAIVPRTEFEWVSTDESLRRRRRF